MRKNILMTTLVMSALSACVFTGCEKSSDAVVDLYDYIGFVDTNEAGESAMPADNMAALAVDGQFSKYRAMIIDGKPYLDIDAVQGYVDDRFYWDTTENLVMFTNATDIYVSEVGGSECILNDNSEDLGYVISRVENDKCYLSMEFVDKFADIDYKYYEGGEGTPPTLRMEYASGEYVTARAKKNNKMRTGADLMNAIITEVEKDGTVTILEKADEWYKVQSEDGFVGYVQAKNYDDVSSKKVDRKNDYDTYTHTLMDEKVKLAWHQVTSYGSNENYTSVTKNMKGINVICPTWITMADNKGAITEITSSLYVSAAHGAGLKVWVLVDDFSAGGDGTKYVNKVLASTTTRNTFINNVINTIDKCGADGVNIDFEYISKENGDNYRQFLREMSIRCRKKGLVMSVDNYVPSEWSEYYGMDQQSRLCDYVIVMSYDEHTASSKEAGPVASISFVDKAIKEATEIVGDSSRVIMGVPFYTRVWKETPEQYVTDGSQIIEDNVNGNYALDSEAVSMDTAKKSYTSMGVQPVWNEETGTNYVYYEIDNVRYMMWLEDKESIAKKLEVAQKYNAGGIACWKLGLESKDVWKTIEGYK